MILQIILCPKTSIWCVGNVQLKGNAVQGNRRTPDKFVGKKAIITSQSLNGWSVY